jgi:hypothetical protein
MTTVVVCGSFNIYEDVFFIPNFFVCVLILAPDLMYP